MKQKIGLKSFSSFLVALGLIIGVNLFSSGNAQAIAPGCSSARPTAITGSVFAYGGTYNNWTVDVLVGIDLTNASGTKVDVNGHAHSSGFSYVDTVNKTLAQPGVSSGPDRTIGANAADGNGVLCVASSIKYVFFELFPKENTGITSKAYFGGSNDAHMTVNAGKTNTYALRLPTIHSYGGNTGDVNGYVTYKKHKVNPSNLVFRVWPFDGGSACGVQGFSAAADNIGYSSSRDATYYLIQSLAGGQCGAKTQRYRIFATCKSVCGSSSVTKIVFIDISNGGRLRADISF